MFLSITTALPARWAALGALAIALLPACGSDGGSSPEEGLGSVRLAMSEAACDALEVATVIESIEITFEPSPAPLTDLSFSRQQLEAHCQSEQGAALEEFAGVPVNSYTANAAAYRSDDVLVGAGSEDFEVRHGELTEVTITLSPVEGQGDVSVDIDFEGDWSNLEGSDG